MQNGCCMRRHAPILNSEPYSTLVHSQGLLNKKYAEEADRELEDLRSMSTSNQSSDVVRKEQLKVIEEGMRREREIAARYETLKLV